jgi:hypothetical protein
LLKHGSYEERPVTDADRQWWSFQKPVRPAAPQVGDARWNAKPIDAFVKKALDEKGLQPAPVADRNTLIRRAYLDLVGLLPEPAEVNAFVNDPSPQAYERLIDKLLASPHYGERWGRLWLDVARYADSTGYEYDRDQPEAWRYRDYVIKAFNEDKPYNQFIVEQLAGDELDEPTFDSATATGFIRLGPRVGIREEDNPQYRFDYLDDIVRTTYQGFQALTVHCARCHDHKFDPITRKDYYKSVAAFNGFVEYDHPLVPADEWARYETIRNEVNAQARPIRRQIAEIEAPYREAAFQKALRRYPADIQEAVNTPEGKRTPGQKLLAEQVISSPADNPDQQQGGGYRRRLIPLDEDDSAARRKLLDQVAELEKQIPPRPPIANGIRDGDFRFVQQRSDVPGTGGIDYGKFGFTGKFLPQPGDDYEPPPTYFASNGLGRFADEIKAPVIAPGFLTVLSEGNPLRTVRPRNDSATSGRRRALAELIASEENPLTARVMVNRIWYQHFGKGIVSTPSNFGKMGTKPNNLELLDWLATEFMRQGWSIKQMHRLIMNSETYKMASTYYRGDNAEKDPTNEWLWRFPVKRLEGEIIRDITLSASGQLNLQAGGPPFFPSVAESVVAAVATQGKWQLTKEEPSTWRRSVYSYNKRQMKYPMFDVFDQPDMNISCERRDVTTVATQALTLLNNEFFLMQARAFAERVVREAGPGLEAQVVQAYRIAFSRDPNPKELKTDMGFVDNQTQSRLAGVGASAKPDAALDALTALAHVMLNANEFIYVN